MLHCDQEGRLRGCQEATSLRMLTLLAPLALLPHCRGEVLRLGEQLRLQQPVGAWPATPGVPEPRSVLQGALMAQFSALMATPPCGFSELVTKASDSWEYLDEEEGGRGGSPGRRLAGSPSRLGMTPRGRCKWRAGCVLACLPVPVPEVGRRHTGTTACQPGAAPCPAALPQQPLAKSTCSHFLTTPSPHPLQSTRPAPWATRPPAW